MVCIPLLWVAVSFAFVSLATSQTRSSSTSSITGAQNAIPTHYGYLLFPTFELIDVMGPLEVLSMLSWTQHPMKLSLISNDTLNAVSNDFSGMPHQFNNHTWSVRTVPDYTLNTAPQDIDILFIPGGIGTRAPLGSTQPYVDFIRTRYPSLKYIFGICTGVGFLARSGVLDGRNATTNKGAWNATTTLGPEVNWVKHARWVQDGNIWTTSGVSAGIDGTLAYVQYLYNETVADNLAKGMEYVRIKDSSNDPFAWEVGG